MPRVGVEGRRRGPAPNAATVDRDVANPPTVLLLGGRENLVSAARAFTGRRIPVVTVADDDNPGHHSRDVVPERIGPAVTTERLAEWFDRRGADHLGAVVIPLSDPALIFVADRYEQLRQTHRPAVLRPDLVHALLDVSTTNQLARSAGLAVPDQWSVANRTELDAVADELRFPVLVTPRHAGELVAATGCTFRRADDLDEVHSAIAELTEPAGGFVISQFIEGPDTRSASYHAVRQGGVTRLSFTTRIVRRHPRHEGGATLSELIDLPEVASVGEQFVDRIGIEGLADVEFKQAPDDDRWYLIACNSRLTAANELMRQSGIDVAGTVYRQALGEPLPDAWDWTGRHRYLWYPVRDLRSARQGDPGIGLWLKMLTNRPVLPYFDLGDVGPSWQQATTWTKRQWRARMNRRRAATRH